MSAIYFIIVLFITVGGRFSGSSCRNNSCSVSFFGDILRGRMEKLAVKHLNVRLQVLLETALTTRCPNPICMQPFSGIAYIFMQQPHFDSKLAPEMEIIHF